MKLYVGTYAKYASGSIAGAWLDLDKFANADEFEAACRRLHKDERDPELMFQDVETDPGCDWQEGLYSESSIPSDYWTLKAEFAAKAKEEERNAPKGAKAEREEQARLLDRFMEITKLGEDMRKYFSKGFYFITLSGGEIFEIKKPSIKTRFCCGEDDRGQGGDGYGTMAFAHEYLESKRTEEGFKGENMDEFDKGWIEVVGRLATIKRILHRHYRHGYYLRPQYNSQHGDPRVLCLDAPLSCGYYSQRPEEYRRPMNSRDINAEDVRRIRAGYARVRKDYRKRLNAYWKRFGASKIHTWTYWTEA